MGGLGCGVIFRSYGSWRRSTASFWGGVRSRPFRAVVSTPVSPRSRSTLPGRPEAGASAAPCSRSSIARSEQAGIWTIQTGIFPENTASLALHERAGFRVVGTRERIGRHRRHLARRRLPRTPPSRLAMSSGTFVPLLWQYLSPLLRRQPRPATRDSGGAVTPSWRFRHTVEAVPDPVYPRRDLGREDRSRR